MNDYTNEQLLEAASVLDRAQDVILEHGWWGMQMLNLPDSRCMEAAIIQAVTGREAACPADTWIDPPKRRLLPEWLIELYESRGINYVFNDVVGRTEDEVFERMRSVAKQLREEASP